MKKLILFFIVAAILVACSSTSKQTAKRELTWNKVVTAYHETRMKTCLELNEQGNVIRDENNKATFKADGCVMSADEADKAIALMQAYRTAATNFVNNPELSACTMAETVQEFAPYIDIELPDLSAFCNQISEIDKLLAGLEATEFKNIEGL